MAKPPLHSLPMAHRDVTEPMNVLPPFPKRLQKLGAEMASLETRCTLPTIQQDHEAFAAPQFDVVAVYQLLCPQGCIIVAIAYEGARGLDVPVVAHREDAVLVHLGDCSPGDEIHSLRAAVSACLARRSRSSRLKPAGVPLASLRRRFA